MRNAENLHEIAVFSIIIASIVVQCYNTWQCAGDELLCYDVEQKNLDKIQSGQALLTKEKTNHPTRSAGNPSKAK